MLNTHNHFSPPMFHKDSFLHNSNGFTIEKHKSQKYMIVETFFVIPPSFYVGRLISWKWVVSRDTLIQVLYDRLYNENPIKSHEQNSLEKLL